MSPFKFEEKANERSTLCETLGWTDLLHMKNKGENEESFTFFPLIKINIIHSKSYLKEDRVFNIQQMVKILLS